MRKFYLAVSVLLISNLSFAQVIVNIIPPSTNQLKITDLWRCMVTSSSTMGFRADEIKVELKEAKTGLQVESKLKSVIIAGSKTFSFNDFNSASLTYRNAQLQEAFSKNLNAPDGNYTICVFILNERGEEVASDCIEQSIENIIPEKADMQLISPPDASSFNINQSVLFTWIFQTNKFSADLLYGLKIVEIIDDQSPSEAVKHNPIWYENNEIRTAVFQYPISARKFEPGKKYAWTVKLINRKGPPIDENLRTADAFMFSFEKPLTPIESIIPQLITPADESIIALIQPVVFTWITKSNIPQLKNSYILKVVEISGNQSPNDAVNKNPVWFESSELRTHVLQYPISARKFEPGKKYAWAVRILNREKSDDEDIGIADAFGFTVEKAIVEDKPENINLQLVSPADGTELNPNQPVLFSWLLSSLKPRTSIMYKMKVVQVLGSQSTTEAISRNPAWFDKSDITATSLIYPVSAKGFEINKKYAWQITAFERSIKIGKSEIWNFIYTENELPEEITETKQCDVFKVEFKKTNQNDTISYKLLITNNYKGKFRGNKPSSFRITVKGDSIVSIAGGVTDGWKRTPSKFPPASSRVYWTNLSGIIPNDTTNLGNIIFRNIYSKPVKVVYEWLDKDEATICKDSSTFFESRLYYELTTEFQNNFIEVPDNFLNIQFLNNYISNDNITLNIYNIEENEFVKPQSEKEKKQNEADKKNIQINNNGLNRISINLKDYKLLPKTAYLLIVSDSKKNHYLKFKVTNDREK